MRNKAAENVQRVRAFVEALGYPEYIRESIVDCIFDIAEYNGYSLETVMRCMRKNEGK